MHLLKESLEISMIFIFIVLFFITMALCQGDSREVIWSVIILAIAALVSFQLCIIPLAGFIVGLTLKRE